MPSSTLIGRDQLSYWAARIRNTMIMAKTKTMAAVPSAFFSWYDTFDHW